MAVTITNIIPRKNPAVNFETQYTANNCTTVIDKFTITNITANNIIFSVYLVPSGGNNDNTNLVLYPKAIARYTTYTCPEIVGQVLLNDGFIVTYASAATSLVLSASGREIT
jgi:hypothetical protein